MRKYGLVVAWMVLVPSVGRAQNCIPLGARLTSWAPKVLNMQLWVDNNSCFETEVFLHYLYSQGRFASALAFGDLAHPPAPSSCALSIPSDIYSFGQTGSGEFRAPGGDCLRYTGVCDPSLSATGCTATDSTQSGEISCWCQPPVTVQQPTLPSLSNPATQFPASYFINLYIDRNRDAVADHLHRGAWGEASPRDPQVADPELPGSPVRAQFLWNSLVQLDFEDWFKDGQADFNDYSALVEFRTCFPERFPEQLRLPQPAECHDPCHSNSCLESDMRKDEERWAARVTFDVASSEVEYESNGRLLRVTVVGYEDYLTPKREIAVCPVLNLRWPRARLSGEVGDLTTRMNYDASFCSGGPSVGLPVCDVQFLSQSVLPVSLRRNETVAPSCNDLPVVSDVHRTEPANKCGPDLFFSHYELSLRDLDLQLADPLLRFGQLNDQDILASVDSVDVYLFYDIKTPEFQCPSGVNALLGSVSPSVARVTRTKLAVGDSSLDVALH